MFQTLKSRLKISSIAFILLISISFIFCLSYISNQILEEEEDHLKENVEIAYDVLVYYNNQVVLGKMSKEEAQKIAKNIIKGIHYSGYGYFFIFDYNCIQIVQPVNPEYEGLNRCDFADKNGKFYYRNLLEAARSSEKSGYVNYVGPKPNSVDIRDRAEKVSYVRGFDPWQWGISTGFYISHLQEHLREIGTYYGLLYGLFLIISSGILLINIFPLLHLVDHVHLYINSIVNKKYNLDIDYKSNLIEGKEIIESIDDIRKQLSVNEPEHRTSKTFFDKDFFTK